jgi:23S rRNA (cytosine1962-C5)-methyltransferase
VYIQKENISNAIIRVLGNGLKSIYDKSSETISKHFTEKTKNGFLFGCIETEDVLVIENNHVFKIDFINGQKTGFFIDQRDNRKLLGKYCKNKAVLNTFSYTGGFSVYASKSGANTVDSVDVSQGAINLCEENIRINDVHNHQCFVEDTFAFLNDKKNSYDVIILDPPAFAKSRESKHNAVTAYKRARRSTSATSTPIKNTTSVRRNIFSLCSFESFKQAR